MSAEELISLIAECSFVVLAVLTCVRAIRTPRWVKIHTAVFFGMMGLVVLASWADDLGWVDDSRTLGLITVTVLLALPYPLLLLAGDFTGVPPLVKRAAEAALILSVLGLWMVGEELPGWFVILAVGYFVGVTTYASAQFTRAASSMRSVSRLRMTLAATGSLALGVVLLVAGFQAFLELPVLSVLANLFAITAGLAYYVGFAMPVWAKQAVHARHLHRFLEESLSVAAQFYRTGGSFEVIEAAVAEAVGTPHARIALWDEAAGALVSPTLGDATPTLANARSTVTFRVYESQRPYFTEDAGSEDPDNASAYQSEWESLVLLAAPITLDDRRFGVLTAFGGLPPFIHDDDLSLLTVMAAQVAIILRNADLVNEVTQAEARVEAGRLMADFFAAVAHDLKTPLTTILGQGQRVQRQIKRQQPIDPQAIDQIVSQSVHMRRLVEDVLDDARDREQYSGALAPTDLRALAEDVVRLAPAGRHELSVVGETAVAIVDPERIRQVLSNLVENAVKYSPNGGAIMIRVDEQDDCATVAVSDQGVGIPPTDLETIFERFSRGSREPDRRFSGLGLGLYTCRRIVQEHGGRIDVESHLGEGSTFIVRLPVGGVAAVNGKVQDVQTGSGH